MDTVAGFYKRPQLLNARRWTILVNEYTVIWIQPGEREGETVRIDLFFRSEPLERWKDKGGRIVMQNNTHGARSRRKRNFFPLGRIL